MWKANIDAKVNTFTKKDLHNSKIVLFLWNKILYFRAQVNNFKITSNFMDNYEPYVNFENREVMCKQTQHLFQEVCQEKQHSSGIINDEYRINGTQFRTTMHRYCQKIKYCIFVSKSRNFKTTFISSTTGIYVNFVKSWRHV